MTLRRPAIVLLLSALAVPIALSAQQGAPAIDEAGDARRALQEARSQAARASERASRLEAQASGAVEAADRTAQESAAIAARIQQVQAEIAGHEAQARMIEGQRNGLRAELARRQRPLVQLTAALQRLSRRPMALALLRPGSIRDAMHMRALVATMLPQVEARTAALRGSIARARALEGEARRAAERLQASRRQLDERRQALAAIETRQRLEARDTGGAADREAERALALSERARDLTGLVARIGEAGELRVQLAALPGPIPRPSAGGTVAPEVQPAAVAAAPASFMLPVDGRLVTGFGDASPGAPRSRGIALQTRGGAQVVAPASGRVAFAGPYRGYGQIVIIEHAGGWTSLVTGIAQLDVRVGQQLLAGSPLGVAGPGRPVLGLELRRNGEPLNPLDLLRGG